MNGPRRLMPQHPDPDRIAEGTAAAWHVGNAARDGAHTRGWFVGPFLAADAGVRATGDFELKWAQPKAQQRRPRPVCDETRTTVVILIEGKCRIMLGIGAFVLAEPGDYAMWGPGIGHTWEILEDSTIVTMRWFPHENRPTSVRLG